MWCCICNNSNETSKDQIGSDTLVLEQAHYEEEVFPGKEEKPTDMFHSMNDLFECEHSLGTFRWHN